MSSLLQYAYVKQHCNVCDGSYRVTLYEMLMEHQVHNSWKPTRPSSVCSLEHRPLMWAVPANLLEDLRAAWEQVARAADDAHLDLRVGGQTTDDSHSRFQRS